MASGRRSRMIGETRHEVQFETASDGLSLPYRCFRAAQPKASLVYLHGIQSHGAWYVETAEELARRGYSVYLPDRRGSGLSPGPRGHFPSSRSSSWTTCGCFVRRAKQDEAGRPTFVVGGCWGARPAIDLRAGGAGRDRRARARLSGAEGEGRPAAGREAARSSRDAFANPQAPGPHPARAGAVHQQPALPRVHPGRPARPPRGDGLVLLPAVPLGPPPAARARPHAATTAAPVRAGPDRRRRAPSARGSTGCAAPDRRYVLYPEFDHLLDFEPGPASATGTTSSPGSTSARAGRARRTSRAGVARSTS